MVNVTSEEISLTDERRIRAIVKRLGLPHLTEGWVTVVSFGRPLDSFAYWERYLLDRQLKCIWRGKLDVWLTPYENRGVLRRVVIEGLQSEQDAEALRSEVWKRRHASDEGLTLDDIRQVAEEVVASRPQRGHQQTFRHALSKVRHYFKWENGEVVETDGWWINLPISKLKLSAEEVETLRRVYAGLPPTLFGPKGEEEHANINVQDAPCPLCGGRNHTKTDKPQPLKSQRTARKQVADKEFRAWVNARLTDEDKAGVWTQPRTLYDDYQAWIAVRRESQTVGDHAESKAAVMSETAWGTLMGKMFAKRKDGKKGYWYNVRLRKRVAAA